MRVGYGTAILAKAFQGVFFYDWSDNTSRPYGGPCVKQGKSIFSSIINSRFSYQVP